MKSLLAGIICLAISVAALAQRENPNYNKTLADSLGADAYGMKLYILVILKSGTNTFSTKPQMDSIFRGHLQNINRLAIEGKLVVAGPLQNNEKNYRGIFILNVKTIKEATGLLETDPAIVAKLLDAELFQWYGSAALPQHLKYHKMVEKLKF